jgi:uncharacterized protein DUF6920
MGLWLKILLIVAFILAVTLGGALVYGARRWKAGTRELRARLEAGRVPIHPAVVHLSQLDDLPAPVQRYFRKVLKEGQPFVAAVNVRHSGTFNLGETKDQWRSFTSDQRVITKRPGFDWNGRISVVPGLPALVHDAYITGEGILHVALFGLLSLANLRGTGDIATGELMRFVAEAAWYPTALLPSQGLHWEGVDDHSARLSLTDGKIGLSMLFTFNEQDLIEKVYAAARGRTLSGKVIPTPWQGRFWNYAERGGMLVPLDGEVAWLLPNGAKPYWRGRITEIAYEFAR